MADPRLTPDQPDLARVLLDEVRARLVDLRGGSKELQFAHRRNICNELMHDERNEPMVRRRLKQLKMKEQEALPALRRAPARARGGAGS
jgi:hypothetical protein